MSQKKTFMDKLHTFVFGAPRAHSNGNAPPTVAPLEGKVDELLTLLKAPQAADPTQETVDGLAAQVRKLAKTQFKANTLQESQLAQQQETIANLQKSLEQQEKQLADLHRQRQQAIESAQIDLLSALLPVLDGLDAAFESGKQQVLKLKLNPSARRAAIAWLDGVRLSRLRLLGLLESRQITPIPAIGRPFDPNYHVAVAVKIVNSVPAGTIVAEDRRGYAAPNKTLRFAEVVVAKSE